MSHVISVSEIVPFNLWDSIRFADPDDARELVEGWFKLANTVRHIGHVAYCNYQVPGQLAYGGHRSVVQNAYARTDIPLGTEVWQRFFPWARKTSATLYVNEKRMWEHKVDDLLAGKPLRPEGQPFACPHCDKEVELEVLSKALDPAKLITVTPRSHVVMRVDGPRAEAAALVEAVKTAGSAPAVWFHLEGVRGRDVC